MLQFVFGPSGKNTTTMEKDSSNITGHNASDPGDPCNSFEWTIVFCFVMSLSIITWLGSIAVVNTYSFVVLWHLVEMNIKRR